MQNFYIGQAVLHEDRANYRIGHIVAIDASETKSFTIGAGGMVPVQHEITIAYYDCISSVPDSIAARYVEDAKRANISDINESEAATKKASAEFAQSENYRNEQEKRDEHAREVSEWRDKYRSQVPAWAKAVIVAKHNVDECDSMTDYFHASTDKVLILGFSKQTRDIFSEMRKFCAGVPEVEQLATKPEKPADADKWWSAPDEHREKYSMGGGYYLKDGSRYCTGWMVCKVSINGEKPIESVPYGEWRVSEKPAKSTQFSKAKAKSVDTVTIQEGKKPGYVEILFPDKPDESIRNELKSAGFRWSRFNGVWYGKESAMPARFAQ